MLRTRRRPDSDRRLGMIISHARLELLHEICVNEVDICFTSGSVSRSRIGRISVSFPCHSGRNDCPQPGDATAQRRQKSMGVGQRVGLGSAPKRRLRANPRLSS